MPHVIIDYSENITDKVKSAKICEALHQGMIDSGLFSPEAVKTRALQVSDFLVGNKGKAGKFIHVSVAILSGRTIEQRQKLSVSLVNILEEKLSGIDSLTVEIREMDKETYLKISTT